MSSEVPYFLPLISPFHFAAAGERRRVEVYLGPDLLFADVMDTVYGISSEYGGGKL